MWFLALCSEYSLHMTISESKRSALVGVQRHMMISESKRSASEGVQSAFKNV